MGKKITGQVKGPSSFIELFGNFTTKERFQKIAMYIILMGIQIIISPEHGLVLCNGLFFVGLDGRDMGK